MKDVRTPKNKCPIFDPSMSSLFQVSCVSESLLWMVALGSLQKGPKQKGKVASHHMPEQNHHMPHWLIYFFNATGLFKIIYLFFTCRIIKQHRTVEPLFSLQQGVACYLNVMMSRMVHESLKKFRFGWICPASSLAPAQIKVCKCDSDCVMYRTEMKER